MSHRTDKLDVDIAMMQDNMDSLLNNQMNLMKVSMDMETRKRESAIIRDLQKKMATYSTDKVCFLFYNLPFSHFNSNTWEINFNSSLKI
jgi:hypothetical protein